MRVLFIISTLRQGGAERVCAILANKFSKYHHVILVVFEKDNIAYDIDSSVQIVVIDEGANDLGFIQNFKKRILKILKIRKVIKNQKTDVVISFLDSTNILVLIASIFLNIRVIISEHTSYKSPKMMALTYLKRIFYPFSSGLSVLSDVDKRYYDKFCKNVSVIYNPSFCKEVDNYYKKENLIIFVGRLCKVKNPQSFVRICSKFKGTNYKFIVAGDGPCMNELVALSKELDVDIEFLGSVKEIQKLYKRAKFLLSTSKFEGLGNTLIESIFYNCVRISTPTSGAKELIRDGFDGFLCSNEDDMIKTIKELMDDEGRVKEICENAHIRSCEFDIDTIYNRWMELIQKS